MKKYHIILLVFLGLLFSPDNAMACGRVTLTHSCCDAVSSTETDKKDCCNSSEKDHSGCDGNCGDTKCNCSLVSSTSSIHFVSETTFKSPVFSYSSFEKAKYSYTMPSISAGFYFIWLIPKIG